MKAPLRLTPNHNPTLLQQIPIDIRARDAPVRRETDPHELSEPTRIIIPLRLRVAERFKNGIRLENLSFEKPEAGLRLDIGVGAGPRNRHGLVWLMTPPRIQPRHPRRRHDRSSHPSPKYRASRRRMRHALRMAVSAARRMRGDGAAGVV